METSIPLIMAMVFHRAILNSMSIFECESLFLIKFQDPYIAQIIWYNNINLIFIHHNSSFSSF